jgi:hypothetical protein
MQLGVVSAQPFPPVLSAEIDGRMQVMCANLIGRETDLCLDGILDVRDMAQQCQI